MPIHEYVRPDFTLEADRVEREGEAIRGFAVRAMTSPAGEGSWEERAFPPDLRRQLGQLERRKLDIEGIIALGEQLAELLLPPATRELLRRSLERLLPEQGLRLRLRLDRALADVPWEYLYLQRASGEKDPTGFLALDPRLSVVRHEALPLSGALDTRPRGRRLLAVLASPDDPHYAPLQLKRELANLRQALLDVPGITLEVVDKATSQRLEEKLLPGADIFHFAGHGDFPPTGLGPSLGSVVGKGQIVLVDGDNKPAPMPAEQLAVNLQGRGVQLAVLGACRSGRRDEQNMWSGVVTALMEVGIPAAVAMQYTVWDDSALAFSRRFYQALAAGLPLDQAVSAGRLAVFNLCHALKDDPQRRDFWRDWGVPVLYLRAEQDFVLPAISDAGQRRVVAAASRSAVQLRLDEIGPKNPYKFLSPYSEQDQNLFKGREAEVQTVLGRCAQQRLLVLWGQAGAGKTSLLNAGVIPAQRQRGALVARIEDYTQPLPAIHAALAAGDERVPLALPGELHLPALLRAAQEATGRPCFLVLDQFERLFEPGMTAPARTALIQELVSSLQELEPQALRVILAVPQETLGQLGELQAHLPELMVSAFELPLLEPKQAQAAIEAPLALGYPLVYEKGLVAGQIVPDLDELTPEQPGLIRPAHLQIVCRWLYEEALRRHAAIDEELYIREGKGADGILARYLAEILNTQLAGEKELAERLLKRMSSPGLEGGLPLSELARDGEDPERVRQVAGRLVRAELWVPTVVDGQLSYQFASSSMASEVRRWAGPEVERRYQADSEVSRIWSAWLAALARPGDKKEVLATRGQLRRLAEDADYLNPSAVRTLLLLRSAVARDEELQPWLHGLAKDKNPLLIRQLEEPAAVPAEERSSRSTLDKAGRLLGLDSQTPPQAEGDNPGHSALPPAGSAPDEEAPASPSFGRVALAAVEQNNWISRQTAALALAALSPHEVLNRLDWALREKLHGWLRRQRRAELHGALADANPELALAVDRLYEDRPAGQRLSLWAWRARRRVFRDRQRIVALTLGGALGAGLGLGLLRALTAALTHATPGVHLSFGFYWGAVLGAAVTFGLLLAEPLLLTPGAAASLRQARALLAVLSGTLLFGLLHWAIAGLIGQWQVISSPWLLAVLDLAVGIGLCLALYGQPRAGWYPSLVGWARLAVGALAFFLGQAILVLPGSAGDTLTVAWSGATYEANLIPAVRGSSWFQALLLRCPNTFDVLGLLDAALVGLVLTAGTTVGLLLAGRWLARWRDLVARAGD